MSEPKLVSYPTTTMYWALEQARPSVTNVLLQSTWNGPLDIARLAGAFTRLVACHSALRCALRPEDPDAAFEEEPTALWTHLRPEPVDMPVLEVLEGSPPSGRAARTPFNFGRPPFLKVWVGEEIDATRTVHLLATHTVFDGWSLHLLARDVTQLYAWGDDRDEPRSDYWGIVAAQYEDWAGGKWTRKAAAVAAVLDRLPVRELPRMRSELSVWPLTKAVRFGLGAAATAGIEDLARTRGCTPFAVASGLFAKAIGEVFGWEDLIATTVAANRQPATRDVIGLFANAVFLRLPARCSVNEAIDTTWREMLVSLSSSHIPFPLLRATVPAVRAALERQPRIMVRQQDRVGGHLGKASRFQGAKAQDEPFLSAPALSEPVPPGDPTTIDSVQPAFQFGHDTDLLFDCYFEKSEPVFTLTYRADRLDVDSINDLTAAFRGACAAAAEAR